VVVEMNEPVQRGSMRPRRTLGLAVALSCSLATIARADVRIEGTLEAVRVTTSQDAIADVLKAFAATFNVKYRSASPLDAAASPLYEGSFGQVIARLLKDHNYVIKRDREATEIVVFGRRGETAVPAAAPKDPPSKGVLSRWR
jgi:hypothetical protein